MKELSTLWSLWVLKAKHNFPLVEEEVGHPAVQFTIAQMDPSRPSSWYHSVHSSELDKTGEWCFFPQ